MKRGQIYYVRSNYREEGSEQRGGRPAVIVSNDKNNAKSNTVEVVYMTTKPKTDLPTHVYIESALRPSTLLCEQISTVSEERIGEWIGELTDDEVKEFGCRIGNFTWNEVQAGAGGRRYIGAVEQSADGTGKNQDRTERSEERTGL